MTHKCHAINCQKAIRPHFFMCGKHWFMVPLPIRNLIWQHYRPGQEEDKKPSKDYCYAAVEGIKAVALKEGIQVDWDNTIQCPEIQIYVEYIIKLEVASRAIP